MEAKPAWSAVKASILSFGDELTEAYIYLDATGRELQSVRLTQGSGDAARTQEDRSYPFEFSLPWPEGAMSLSVKISATSVNGQSRSR